MEPFEKKRREARAWVLRAASWKEFMVVTCLYLGSYVVLEVKDTITLWQLKQKDFLMAKILTCTISNVEILRVSATVVQQLAKEGEKYSIGTLCSLPISCHGDF